MHVKRTVLHIKIYVNKSNQICTTNISIMLIVLHVYEINYNINVETQLYVPICIRDIYNE